jgi:hypothetical protein
MIVMLTITQNWWRIQKNLNVVNVILVGRVGNNASVKCTVCNVFLCDNKARFPKCDKTCWEIWYTIADFEKVGKTLCHLKNPCNHGWVTIAKKICITNNKGGKRGVSQSAAKPPELRARKGRDRRE